MVGSVLMQRMKTERDFDHIEPVFFSTSQIGGEGPAIGKGNHRLQDASDVDALKSMDVIITCQGGEYTTEMYPRLRATELVVAEIERHRHLHVGNGDVPQSGAVDLRQLACGRQQRRQSPVQADGVAAKTRAGRSEVERHARTVANRIRPWGRFGQAVDK